MLSAEGSLIPPEVADAICLGVGIEKLGIDKSFANYSNIPISSNWFKRRTSPSKRMDSERNDAARLIFFLTSSRHTIGFSGLSILGILSFSLDIRSIIC